MARAWLWLHTTLMPSRRERRARGGWLKPWLMVGAYAVIVVGPLGILTAGATKALVGGHVDWLRLAVPTGRRLVLLRNSLALALTVGALAAVLGWVGAVFLWSRQARWTRPLIWLMMPLAALPPYLHALAWVTLSQRLSRLLQPLGLSTLMIRGWGGSIWVEVAAYAPLTLACAWLGLRSLDPELVEVARVARRDVQALRHVVLPLSGPSLLTGAGIVFLLSFLDYSVPSLLDVRVYAMEVFAEFSASNSSQRAFLAAVPLLVLGMGVMAVLLENLRALTVRSALHRPAWANPPRWPWWVTLLQGSVGLFFAAQALSPFAVMVARSGVGQGLLTTLGQARAEATYSFATAGLAALLSLPLGLLAARALVHTAPLSGLRWLVVMAPLAVPSSLVGISLVVLSNAPLFRGRVVASLLPSLASAARFAPLTALVLAAQLRRTDSRLFDAASVFQPVWWRRQLQIAVPLLAPALLAGAGLVFALSAGELGATLMVIPPGRATLTMRIYNYLHYGASDTVAGLCLLLGAGAVMAAALGAGAAGVWSCLLTGPEAAQ